MPQQVQASSNTFASGYSPANNTTAQQSRSSTQAFTPTTEQPQPRTTQQHTYSMNNPVHVAQQSLLTAVHERNASFAGLTGTVIGSTTATLSLPNWTMDGGPERLREVLSSPKERERLHEEMTNNTTRFFI